MIPVRLTRIKTRDGIVLDGIVIAPFRKKSATALIWLHGLSSNFAYGQTLTRELSMRCQKNGVGYFKFNTRGHDLIARGQKNMLFLGTLYEQFEDCVHDIRAMIRCAKKLGYRHIILAGHSTGANKAIYYLHRTQDKSVKGVILIGGLNDIAAEMQRVGKKEFISAVSRAKRLNRKNPLALFTSHDFLFTAQRYLSLHTPGAAEDVFPYYNPRASWKELNSIRPPLAVIIGSHDEYLDHPPKKFLSIFQKNTRLTASFFGVIIKGANHSFHGKEKELSRTIAQWITRIKK